MIRQFDTLVHLDDSTGQRHLIRVAGYLAIIGSEEWRRYDRP